MTDAAQHPGIPEAGAPDGKPGPYTPRAVEELRRAIFIDSALDNKTKQLIAVGAAHLTQCHCCIDGHIGLAQRAGATLQEITETIWVAAEIRAAGTFPHPVRGPHSHPDSTPPLPEPRRLEPST